MFRMMNGAIVLAALAALLTGCKTAPETQTEKESLNIRSKSAVDAFIAADPSMRERFQTAHAYAIFPSVGKGAIGVGGAYGKGEVYQGGKLIGYTDLSQGTVGLALGGQEYMEVIFFQNAGSLQAFKEGKFTIAAQASAVAASAGASADADYEDGVLIFTHVKGGLMAEASVGGQNFDFKPVN